jgi:hypothetical protein
MTGRLMPCGGPAGRDALGRAETRRELADQVHDELVQLGAALGLRLLLAHVAGYVRALTAELVRLSEATLRNCLRRPTERRSQRRGRPGPEG